MSLIKVSAKLDRTDSQTPWGFRMAGGKDYNSPLIIQKVNPGSLSSKCGIKESDVITHIGGFDVTNLIHKEAQDLIIGSGNSLELKLERTSGISHSDDGYHLQPSSLPWIQQRQQYKPNNELITLAPKPFQKPRTLTSITSQNANFSLGDSFSSPQVSMTKVTDKSDIGLDKGASPLVVKSLLEPAESMDLNLSQEEYAISNTKISHSLIGSGQKCVDESLKVYQKLDKSSYDEDEQNGSPKSDQLHETDEPKGIFSPRDSQPQSTSFKKLQCLLHTGNVLEDKSVQPSIIRQNSANNKPQILAKPKIPLKTKPAHLINRIINTEKDSVNSSVIEESISINTSEVSPLPESCASLPQLNSCPVKVVPPTKPKPLSKQNNCSISIYSKLNSMESGSKTELSPDSVPQPSEIPMKEVASGNDVIISIPQRKMITAPQIKNESLQSASSVTQDPHETVILSAQRKQIVVKSKPASGISEASITGQNIKIDANESWNLADLKGPIGPDDVVYGTEKAKIIVKKMSTELSNEEKMDSQIGSALQDLGLGDGIVVGLSLPSHMKECLPSFGPEVIESRPQINITPKASQRPIADCSGKIQSYPSQPSSGAWCPQIPAGERKMKIGRPGQAQRRPPTVGSRVPICTSCHSSIRGPFITALDKTWCPEHFVCANPNCAQPLFDCGFVEEADNLYCEKDYEKYLAPRCARCTGAIVGEVVLALGLSLHPKCFLCHACKTPISKYLYRFDSGDFYCLKDWGALFQTKCYGCQFPIEPGDRWVEALSQNWHSECFNCSTCQINLEGQSFCAKNGKPYCKKHGAVRRF